MSRWGRWTVPALYTGLVLLIAACLYLTPWDVPWNGLDFKRYLWGAGGLFTNGDPYTGTDFVYSPGFALLVSPLRLIPYDAAVAAWRIGGLAALALAVRGAGPAAWLVFAFPWLWASDFLAGNLMAYGTAAMIAVVRWPSVRSVVAYAMLVALVPKPAFLPVLAYGLYVVGEARIPVAIVAAVGAAMLAYPGYLGVLTNQGNLAGTGVVGVPLPVTVVLATAVTLLALRRPRLLGLASVVASPYWLPYSFVPLGVGLVEPGAPRPHKDH